MQTDAFAYLQVNNVQRPTDYETAVKEKEGAKENIRIAENERPRRILQAETEYQQALKQADILINSATTNARIIKTKYLLIVNFVYFKKGRMNEIYFQN